MLLDTHHHLDFLPPEAHPSFFDVLGEAGVGVVAQTLTPSSFLAAQKATHDTAVATWSVGYHPWWIGTDAEVAGELSALDRALRHTRFIGEVGLDFSPHRKQAVCPERQREVLRSVLLLVTEAARDQASDEPWVISIHAVRAASEVLDLLDEVDAWTHDVAPVFHRFGGTSDELTRLVRSGGYLSVHPRLLASKRGRAYVTQVPIDRLLLETDLPESPMRADTDEDARTLGRAAAAEVVESLTRTLATLGDVRAQRTVDAKGMGEALRRTQRALYGTA